MKRTFALLLMSLIATSFLFVACSKSIVLEEAETAESVEEPEATIVNLPTVQMIINDDKNDTQTSLKTFGTYDGRSHYAYIHYYVESENATENIRVKIENQWGRDETPDEPFKVESDELHLVSTNKWQQESFSISASNLYFHRVTLYFEETDNVLATKTIYTPYEYSIYTENTIMDTPPAFHPLNSLDKKEQALFDFCNYGIVAFAKSNQCKSVNDLSGWGGSDGVVLHVEYKIDRGYDYAWFAFKFNDPKEYFLTNGDNYRSVINRISNLDENTDYLDDYYYLEQALNKELSK